MAPTIKQRIVLLVDDDVMIRNVLRRALESAGYTVFVAADAIEAFDVSRSCPDPLEVLIADVEMDGMDGIAMAQQISADRPETAVLLISAGTERPIPDGIPFISKPFSPTELIAKIADIAQRRSDDTPSQDPPKPAL